MNQPVKNIFWLLLFFAVTVALYCQTVHAKFVFDFINLAFDFKNKGWGDIGSFTTGLSPYWLIKLIFYGLLKLIGFSEYAWFIISCLLHAFNAWLLFLLTRQIANVFIEQHTFAISLFSALLFLLSPYHTEAVVWGGAFNYLVVSAFVLLHLYALAVFLQYKKNFWLYVAALTFAAALFIHEWGLFLLPANFLMLFLFKNEFQRVSKNIKLALVVLPIFFVGLYFLNQLWHGSLIGHYGAQTHLNFKLHELVPAFIKYLLKLLLLFTFSPIAIQDKVYAWLQQPVVVYAVSVLLLVITLLAMLLYKRKKAYRPAVFFFLLFSLFVFPVLNLYFPYWIPIHADRYCYLTGAFLYASVVFLVFQVKSRLTTVLPIAFVGVSLWFLWQTNNSWYVAGMLQQQLENNFYWWKAKRVFILNVPDNYRGAYMYRNLQTSAFKGAFIKYDYNIPTTDVVELFNYNLCEPFDSVTVEKIDSNQLKVTLSNPGSWWWRNTLGATNYETGILKTTLDEYNHSYIVAFKQRREGDVFLYQANGVWRVFEKF